MYKVRRKCYQRHADASRAAVASSRLIPVYLRAPSGGAWYWRGRYCGRKFRSLLGL